MASFARFIFIFAIWALISCSAIAVLGIFHLVRIELVAVVILPALVFGQISAILVGNWGAIVRMKKFGLWASMTSQRGPGFLELFGYFRSEVTALSLWRWVVIGGAALGLSVGWAAIRIATSQGNSKALPVAFLCAICSIFFLAHALISLGAMRDRGLIGEKENPIGSITPK